MPRPFIHLISLGLLLLLTITLARSEIEPQLESGWVELANGFKIEIEIATTSSQRERGLMHRTVLHDNQGMLFVYPTDAKQAMWMKNMRMDLDVLFISEQGRIVSILQRLPACKQKSCPIYISPGNAKYMLEVNAGFAAKQLITPGQELIIDYKHP